MLLYVNHGCMAAPVIFRCTGLFGTLGVPYSASAFRFCSDWGQGARDVSVRQKQNSPDINEGFHINFRCIQCQGLL